LRSNDPKKVISEKGIKARGVINPLFLKGATLNCKYKQHIVLKKDMPGEIRDLFIDREELPKGAVLFLCKHHFSEDIHQHICGTGRHSYLVFGNDIDMFTTINGMLLWVNGVIFCDRDLKESRQSSIHKMVRALMLGVDVQLYPEGYKNLTDNKLMEALAFGYMEVAKLYKQCTGKDLPIVPICDALDTENKRCYTAFGKPHYIVDELETFEQKKAEEELMKTRMSEMTYYLMEKYANYDRAALEARIGETLQSHNDKFLKEAASVSRCYVHQREIDTGGVRLKDKNGNPIENPIEVYKTIWKYRPDKPLIIKKKKGSEYK